MFLHAVCLLKILTTGKIVVTDCRLNVEPEMQVHTTPKPTSQRRLSSPRWIVAVRARCSPRNLIRDRLEARAASAILISDWWEKCTAYVTTWPGQPMEHQLADDGEQLRCDVGCIRFSPVVSVLSQLWTMLTSTPVDRSQQDLAGNGEWPCCRRCGVEFMTSWSSSCKLVQN